MNTRNSHTFYFSFRRNITPYIGFHASKKVNVLSLPLVFSKLFMLYLFREIDLEQIINIVGSDMSCRVFCWIYHSPRLTWFIELTKRSLSANKCLPLPRYDTTGQPASSLVLINYSYLLRFPGILRSLNIVRVYELNGVIDWRKLKHC